MHKFQLEFKIDKGHLNRFLIGSKSLFGIIESLEKLLVDSVGENVKFTHKLLELDTTAIIYLITIEYNFSTQKNLGNNINNLSIVKYIEDGLSIFLSGNDIPKTVNNINKLIDETGVSESILFVKIPENILMNSLEDLKNLSILLFKDSVFFRKEG